MTDDQFDVPDEPNRAREFDNLRDAFIALTTAHPELAPYMCGECAEAFMRGDEHPAAADALFSCMTDHLNVVHPEYLGPIMRQFFTFNAWRWGQQGQAGNS